MIEVKDYRQGPRDPEKMHLWEEVATKTRETLAGLFAARLKASADEKNFATKSNTALQVRVVLHLEQPRCHSKLFPRAFDLADVQQKLKQLVRAIDPHALVLQIGDGRDVPWAVSSVTSPA